MYTIIVTILGGEVQSVDVPDGVPVEVEVRNYDADEDEDDPGILHYDTEGQPYSSYIVLPDTIQDSEPNVADPGRIRKRRADGA